ncbi:hypothetical protein [Bradyrhizobium neotropicale]|uniref:hypothetical protein n=1 Tax=Bradyrhizobium neotropicale TaxID=1497615 RepID=UPI001AD7B260|nr:hypothetical protein [Bradyrhizobium neotropicale]MBO4224231.1 hypothetical protein [Bradyrhizobium neotropicale]
MGNEQEARPRIAVDLGNQLENVVSCYMVIGRNQEMFCVPLEQTPSERQRIQRTLKLLVYEAMANQKHRTALPCRGSVRDFPGHRPGV